jgi:hypothetical protein
MLDGIHKADATGVRDVQRGSRSEGEETMKKRNVRRKGIHYHLSLARHMAKVASRRIEELNKAYKRGDTDIDMRGAMLSSETMMFGLRTAINMMVEGGFGYPQGCGWCGKIVFGDRASTPEELGLHRFSLGKDRHILLCAECHKKSRRWKMSRVPRLRVISGGKS